MLMRHEGLAPARLTRLENRIGLLSGRIAPHRIDRPVLILGSSGFGPMDAGVPLFALIGLRGRDVGRKRAQASAILKNGASPSLPSRDRRNSKRNPKERGTILNQHAIPTGRRG